MERWKKRKLELAQEKPKSINTVCRWKRDDITKLIQFYMFKSGTRESHMEDEKEQVSSISLLLFSD